MKKVIFAAIMTAALLSGPLRAEEEVPGMPRDILSGEKRKMTMNLEQCIDYTIKHNPELLIRKEQLEEAQAFVGVAFSEILPNARFQGQYNRYDNHPYISYMQNYDYAMNAQQLVFAWGRALNNIKSARLSAKAADDRVAVQRQDVRFRVEDAFYNVLFARELVRISTETLDLAEEQLRVAQERYKAGETSNYDVLREEVNVANLKPQLIKALNQAQTTKNFLKFIMGLEMTTDLELKGQFEEIMEDAEVDASIKEGLANRPEIREVKNREEAKKADIYATWVQYLPQMTMGISNLNALEQAFSPGRAPWSDYWIASVNVTMPIFDGFRIKSQAEAEQARLKQIRTQKERVDQTVKLEVINAILDMKAARELVLSQAKNVERATEGYQIMSKRYAVGKATQVDLLDAQVALTQAKVNYVQAVFAQLVSRARYKQAVGEYSK